MFIFGLRITKGEYIETAEACPFCKEKRSLIVQPCYNYFHILWLPILPLSKGVSITCVACGHKFYVRYKQLSENFRTRLKIPKWQYIGLPLIILFCLFMVWAVIVTII